MIRNSKYIALILSSSFVVGAIASTATAQTYYRSGYSSRSVGNSNLGVYYSSRAQLATTTARSWSPYARSSISASGTLRVLGRRMNLARFSASAASTRSKAQAKVYASVGPFTVLNKSLSPNYSYKRSKSYGYPVVRGTFMVGPIPITVKSKVGVGGSASAKAAYQRFPASVGFETKSSIWAYGSASVAVGVSGAKAGVQGRARFGTQSLSASVKAIAGKGVSGVVRHCSTAIDLSLKLFAELGWWRFKKKWSKTIASYKRGSSCRDLIRL